MALKLKLNRRSKVDLSEQLYETLKQLILDGELTAGERMPSSRDLSAQLKISRPTVAVCLEQLQQEGYIELKHGSGTFVSNQIRAKAPTSALRKVETAKKNGAGDERKTQKTPLSNYARAMQKSDAQKMSAEAGAGAGAEAEPEIAFYCWRPALDQFPHEQWARILGRHARLSDIELSDTPLDHRGETALREAIAGLVLRFRGVKCSSEQVIIVNGLSQAIDLVGRLHLETGKTAVVEEPGYHNARKSFAALGAKIVSAPVDEEGLQVESLVRGKTAPGLVYVTPSHQFPTGQTMSLARRLQLLDWASRHSTLILEDDYDSEYQKVGKPIPALMSLDKEGSVIYAGTLNQLMFPSLGLAYLVVPPHLVSLYNEARAFAGAPLPPHLQKAIAQFIEEGHLDRHIKRLRNLYDERRQILLDELETKLPGLVTISGTESGVFVLARFKTKLTTAEFLRRAQKAGVGLADTSALYAGKAPPNEYILGFGSLSNRKIKDGVKRLAEILKRA
jgi:GntR family transcriptional regulator/MocR family aminotransferase